MTPNFKNATVWTGDNLDVMRGMNSKCVDLIYLDPPFSSNQAYAAPIGSEAAGAAFKDTWTLDDIKVAEQGELADRNHAAYAVIEATGLAHGERQKAYLIMMAVRILEMYRVLKPKGSIYLHCDPKASHYLKLLMDTVFGPERFLNEIVWSYGLGGSSPRYYSRKHDIILFYSKSKEYTFHKPTVPARSQMLMGQMKGATDVWDIPSINNMAKERTGYPTQKPLKLLRRIVEASTDKGDLVLDPFCGCATTCVAADELGRKWAGIDLSPLAVKLVVKRLKESQTPFFENVIAREDPPVRTDLGELPNYRTHKHTLFGLQEGLCNGCRVGFPFRNFTIDHIVPRLKGGQDNIENLQLLCSACNSTKGIGTQAELIAKLKDTGFL